MTVTPRDSLAREAAADYPREPLPLARSILWYPARRGSRDTGGRGAGYSVFVDQGTLDHVRQHLEDAPDEARLGFLTGQLYTSELEIPYLVIDGVFKVKYPIEADDPMPLFRRIWDRLQDEATRNRILLAGWYRSCPRGDVTLSRLDMAAHEAHFTEPWHVAMLARVDRMRPGGGMYRRVPGTNWTTTPISFYEMLASAPRSAAGGKRTRLTWKNYHTNELVLAADERGIRPQDADPRPTPTRRTPTAEESRRPTLQVVRPVVPQSPPQSRSRTTVRTEAVGDAPAAPRATPVVTPRPADEPDVVRVQPRRRRRLTNFAAALGLAAAVGLGALLLVQGLSGPDDIVIDGHAARVARLDRVSDTLGPALRNYGERAELFREGLLACEGLTRGYAAVDTLWLAYRQVRRGFTTPLDDARRARDGRLTVQVDAMRREFARAGCTAP